MPTVLLIEDDVSLRSLFREWLSHGPYRVWDRSDIAASSAWNVNLVVVDLRNLRKEAGVTVTQVKHAYPNAQVIGLSTQLTRAMDEASPLALALGVKALLPKPCGQEELLEVVRAALGPAAR